MIDRDVYRVLLVEDNELDARSVIRALSADGSCEVERVADLRSGLAAVRDAAFDCVLLDLSLPDSDGLVSVETMVARSPHCPVVVLTGLDDPELAVEAVGCGAQDYLVKNTMTAELVARAIRYAVARHSVEVELVGTRARLENMQAREQIARDLHDTVIQRLFATGLTLQAATALPTRDEVVERAGLAVGQIDEAIRELREAIFGLNVAQSEKTISAEVAEIVDSFRDGLGFDPLVRVGQLPDLDPEICQDLLASLSEALSNVLRHADASAATVTVAVDDGQLMARVTDNGRGSDGVDLDGCQSDGSDLSGRGLANMRSRAEAHNGTMSFQRGRTGGSELCWSVPL